jgi:hypothetical protein
VATLRDETKALKIKLKIGYKAKIKDTYSSKGSNISSYYLAISNNEV